MKLLKKHKGKIFIIIFAIFTVFTIYDTYSMEKDTESEVETKPEITEKEEQPPKETNNKVIVDVKGEVNTPGVYELTEQNTVLDAIN